MAERFAHVVEYAVRVAHAAKRVGPDRAHLLGAKVAKALTEELEARDRALLGVLGEPSAILQTRRESHGLSNAIDDLDAPMIHAGNHHVKAVRP
jgi:hypothetical protein